MTIADLKSNFLSPLLKSVLTLTTFLLICSGLIWIYFIAYGTIELGNFPKYGDPELISFDGFDRKLIVGSTFIMFYGILTWIGTFLLTTVLRIKRIPPRVLILGISALTVNLLIMFSPSFTWALD